MLGYGSGVFGLANQKLVQVGQVVGRAGSGRTSLQRFHFLVAMSSKLQAGVMVVQAAAAAVDHVLEIATPAFTTPTTMDGSPGRPVFRPPYAS